MAVCNTKPSESTVSTSLKLNYQKPCFRRPSGFISCQPHLFTSAARYSEPTPPVAPIYAPVHRMVLPEQDLLQSVGSRFYRPNLAVLPEAAGQFRLGRERWVRVWGVLDVLDSRKWCHMARTLFVFRNSPLFITTLRIFMIESVTCYICRSIFARFSSLMRVK